MQISRDREEPRSKPRVGIEPARMRHEAQPGFLEQIFGNIPAPGEARQEPEQPAVELGMHDIEGGGIAVANPSYKRELTLPVHVRRTLDEAMRDNGHGERSHAFLLLDILVPWRWECRLSDYSDSLRLRGC